MRFLVLAAFLLTAGPACAHAFLRDSSPPVGATVTAPPTSVSIDFTEELEPHFSAIEVRDAQGRRVDKNDLHAAPNDAKHVSVSLGQLSPGRYTVSWRALSVDTHRTQGTFTFTVAP